MQLDFLIHTANNLANKHTVLTKNNPWNEVIGDKFYNSELQNF